MTYGNGSFVMVGGNGGIFSSADGIKWTFRPSGTTAPLHGVAYGENLFIVVGENGAILSSQDGVSWKVKTYKISDWWGIVYGNGNFVAVGYGGDILVSPDGINWTAKSSGVPYDLVSIAYAFFYTRNDI